MASRIRVFLGYALEDECLAMRNIEAHLETIWWQRHFDLLIAPISDASEDLAECINMSDIILIPLSQFLLGSGFCNSELMLRAIERWRRGEVFILPIHFRKIEREETPFAGLQWLPGADGSKPMMDWRNKDTAAFNIEESVRRIIDELDRKRNGGQRL